MGLSYAETLAAKRVRHESCGFDPQNLNGTLYPFQADIARWALRKGRACVFAATGLGKTRIQLAVADQIPGRTLILAPLAVSAQTQMEAINMGVDCKAVRSGQDAEFYKNKTIVTNYERLHLFDPNTFDCLILDESSILKSHDGQTRKKIMDFAHGMDYRFAFSATPAPNDHMELGTHAEFVGCMTREEMLAMFFTHDGGSTSKWRVKGHAKNEFWDWVCSWGACVVKPSDLGYSDEGYDLPPLNIEEYSVDTGGYGFTRKLSATDMHSEMRKTAQARAERVREIVTDDRPWIVWCNTDYEQSELERLFPEALSVKGSDSVDKKERDLVTFSALTDEPCVLITKPRVAGFGMNWQHCADMAFVGLSYSFEQMHQAVRRCWRFGQSKQVNVHIVSADTEGCVADAVKRKEKDFEHMTKAMRDAMGRSDITDARTLKPIRHSRPTVEEPGYTAVNGDCVAALAELPDDTFGYSVFSPPFASLYTYSDQIEDMGNCKDENEFAEQFAFLVKELYRTLKPGRNLSFHCMNLPRTKERDGVIGLKDFRGQLIRMFEDAGFIFHSEVCIWKDPVTAMQRTKAIGLLYKQLKKDSCISRQGIPDYLVTMRKPGVNPEPVEKCPDDFPVSLWQEYASPVWSDINPSDTLQRESARDHDDERHICPLQLEVIERAVTLWSNPGDLVLSPFMGIGSEGYVSLRLGRTFYGIELKQSYFDQASKNLANACRCDQFSLDFA